MKKFGIAMLAAALSLPAMFAASQAGSTTPAPAGQAQTSTPKTSKRSHKVKKHHVKKQKAAKGSAATTGSVGK